jgi:beta-glucanase (GH16 family)
MKADSSPFHFAPRRLAAAHFLMLGCIGLAGPAPRARAASPTLVWHDEFNQPVGTGPDTTKWTYDLGAGNPVGWGNNELETYTNSRSNSVIVADPDATDGKALAIIAQGSNGSYTSARLNTQTTYSFTYGRLETRARMPAGAGLWPAFWALGSNITTVTWPACGEIDVMEWIGSQAGQVDGSLHATGYPGSGLTANAVLPGNASYSDAYHVFAVDWYPNEIVFSVDGVVYEDDKEADIPSGYQWPFVQPFFILLNLAVGGNFPGPPNSGTAFPQSYLIDYVRVYSLPSSTPPASLVWAPSPPANVSAYSPSPSKIFVSWHPPFSTFGATVTGYTLVRATDPALTQNVTQWNMGMSTSFTDTSAQAGVSYYYSVTAASANGSSDPSGAVLAASVAPAGNAAFSNISSRALVGTGANVAIPGFVIAGSTPMTLLIRASGPALSLAPFSLQGTLPDPLLQLYRGNADGTSTLINTNQGWGGSAQIVSTAAGVGAYSWPNAASSDSALLVTLQPGAYTADVSGASNDTGISLVEVYSAQTGGNSSLSNISSRQFVGTQGNVAIPGFVIGGSTPMTVLIRASGPVLSLTPFNLSGTLPDPLLQLYRSNDDGTSSLIGSDAGWGGNPQVMATASAVGAYAWSDASSTDSALLVTLPPGAYTAVVSGASGDTGVSLVELYAVP